ncbi:MAG TPA: CocE/NonD family hydrolase, partial [Gemmatimonadales bacterium]|nr:CocE/NonD family hydrolase [Gemmatimonadales bacterium]
VLAREVLAQLPQDSADPTLNTRFRLQFVAGDYRGGLATLHLLRRLRSAQDSVYARGEYTQYEIVARSALSGRPMGEVFDSVFGRLSDRVAYRNAGALNYDLDRSSGDLFGMLRGLGDTISLSDAIRLLRQYHTHTAYRQLVPVAGEHLRADTERRYRIEDPILVRTADGNAVHVTVVRPRALTGPQPALLSFTIYASRDVGQIAQEMAANGYIGVVATSRGKRESTGPIKPFACDGSDANDVIDWISRQPWSNGSVGMLGGSYSGWTQWAAAMRLHPALKTIVPSAAIVPGFDSPLENGVYQGWQYPWIAYTTNNRWLDDDTYRERDRWARLDSTWYATGVAYRALDSIDGTPNPLWHEWISHPTYDTYWQRLSPQDKQFGLIRIPVLTTTGYFDGAQVGALRYFRDHTRHNPKAEHYLLIGPWEHFGSQGRPLPVVAGYAIDPVARVDITAVIYQWFDYILKQKPRPAILADRVNYQVMGTNGWKHAKSLGTRDTLSLYLRAARRSGVRVLSRQPGPASESVAQRVDLRNRNGMTTNAIPGLLADSSLNLTNAVVFVSEPLAAPVTMTGSVSGVLRFVTNKRDMDLGVTLYEEREDGTRFHLSYYLGRLSLARDPAVRRLLVHGSEEEIPFNNARMISKTLAKGSRLVVLLNINQTSDNPVNYGSGKDVYAETVADAGNPLEVEWRATSVIRVPVE